MAPVELNPLLTLLLERTSCNHPQARQKEHGPLATQSKGTACLTKSHLRQQAAVAMILFTRVVLVETDISA